MKETHASHVTWRNGDSEALERAVAEYVERHGIMAFMDEYYNLLGTRPEAVFTAGNRALAHALGLWVPGSALPATVARSEITTIVYWPKLVLDRKFIARFFADATHVPDLSGLQRLFLEWHFLAPRDYSWSLRREPRRILVGWNDCGELHGPGDFEMSTNLMGCTGVCAATGDGRVHMSHYDDDHINPAQVAALADFLRRARGPADIRAVGVHAEKLARRWLAAGHAGPVQTHVKRDYRGTGYWVRFERRGGRLRVSHSETPLSGDYVASTHHTEYGRWFIYGRFGQTFPPADAAFVETPFGVFAGEDPGCASAAGAEEEQ